jgi:TonB family protein
VLLVALKSAKVSAAAASATDPGRVAKDSAALAHLHRAAQLNTNNFHPREAEPEFHEAVVVDPDNPFVHIAWGAILESLGNADAAIAEFRAALKLQPDLPDAHLRLGSALLLEPTQHAEAQEELKQAVTLDPSDAVVHSLYARALEAKGDTEGAAEQWKIADGLGALHLHLRIRVSEVVENARLVYRPNVEYPQEAKAAHVMGRVRLNVLVGGDGTVKDLIVISGDPMLAAAAAEAVKKRRYSPMLLNGRPVEVVTEINLEFGK